MTLKEATLNRLKVKALSPMEAFEELGVTRLAAVVFDLRREGHNIVSIQKEWTNRHGRKVYFTEYKLEESNEGGKEVLRQLP